MGKNKRQKKEKTEKPQNEERRGNPMRAKPVPIGTINSTFIDYYKDILVPKVLTEEEFQKMIDIYRTPLPIVFRLSTNFPHYKEVEKEMNGYFDKMKAEGVNIYEYEYFPVKNGRIFKVSLDKALLRRDSRFRPFRDWLNLQANLGHCHRQEFVSMIPPYFLDVQPTDSALDLCAAPGSKTAQISESLDPESGFVFANDVDPKRCRNLVHNLQKVGTQNVLVTSQKAQFFVSPGVSFDKVLCDVPCTGDGTLRKNAVAGSEWSSKNGWSMHGVQRKILKRGLELTKKGGVCVYSTCSMNPIEDESVVNSVLLETKGAVELVDCASLFPRLKRRSGLSEWPVIDTVQNAVYKEFNDVPEDRRSVLTQSMFCNSQAPNLNRCMRFFPTDDDSGGFFVAVLRKVEDFERLTRPQSTPQQPLKEAPYITMSQGNTEVLQQIMSTFGFDDSFPADQLFVRNEKSVHNVSYIAKGIAELIIKNGSEAYFTISCGSPIFTWRNSGKGKTLLYPAKEGVGIVLKYAHERMFKVTPAEMKLMLTAGHNAVKLSDLSKETYEQVKDVKSTGAVFYIPDTPFAYGGMTFDASITVYLRKDLLPVEKKTLLMAYPELVGPEDASNDEEDEKNDEAKDDEDQQDEQDKGADEQDKDADEN